MKNILQFTFITAFLGMFLFSCADESTNADDQKNNDKEVKDTSAIENDTLSVNEVSDTTDQSEYVSEEDELEELNKEHKQLSFCDCVKKQEALNKKLDEEEDDDALMQLMDEMERLVNEECKILTTSPNTTPDERAAHKRKVQKCLNS